MEENINLQIRISSNCFIRVVSKKNEIRISYKKMKQIKITFKRIKVPNNLNEL